MDLSDIRTEVRDIIGETTADFWTDAELNRYINDALRRFSEEERWTWLLTEGAGIIVASDPDFELTEGVALARHLNFMLTKTGDTRSYMAKRVSAAEGFRLRSMYSTVTTASYPTWFYTTSVADDDAGGDFVYVAKFIPTPTTDIDVEFQYYRQPPELSGNTNVPDLPVQYHKGLVHYAASLAWLKELNGGPKAQEQLGLYSNVLEQARTEERVAPDDTPLIMGGGEPQYGPVTTDEAIRARIPDTLGP